MIRRRIALMLAVLTLAACGEVPQPFRHEGPPPRLARPKMERGVTIRPLADFAAAEPLAAAMVKAMEEREIAAVARPGPAFGHVVEGEVDEDGLVMWRLLGPDGTPVASHRQRLPVFADAPVFVDAADADAARLRRLAVEAVAALSGPLAHDPDAIPQRESDQALANRPSVRLVPLAGLPGDGDKTLTAALRIALDRAGLRVESEGADYLVRGAVTVSPHSAIEESAAFNWTVTRVGDGLQLASIDQGGALPRGRLALPWGALARDIAEGGAAGIAEVVQAARHRRPTALIVPPGAVPPAPADSPAETTPPDPTQFTEQRPADIRKADSSEQNDEARTTAEPASGIAPPPAMASPTKPAKTVKKASPIKATGVKGRRATATSNSVKSSRIKRAQR